MRPHHLPRRLLVVPRARAPSRRIETIQAEADDSPDPVSVLGLAVKREAEFFLPLCEVDNLVHNHSTKASVLDQDSYEGRRNMQWSAHAQAPHLFGECCLEYSSSSPLTDVF